MRLPDLALCMRNIIRKLLFLFLLLYPALSPETSSSAAGPAHHSLEVSLSPGAHRPYVNDTITLTKDSSDEIHFMLHEGLGPRPLTEGVTISAEPGGRG